MTTCTNCGTSVRDGAKFCTSCGARLMPAPDSTAAGWGAFENRVQTSVTTSPWNSGAAEPAAMVDTEEHTSEGKSLTNGVSLAPESETATSDFVPAGESDPFASSDAVASLEVEPESKPETTFDRASTSPWAPPPPLTPPASTWDADWLQDPAVVTVGGGTSTGTVGSDHLDNKDESETTSTREVATGTDGSGFRYASVSLEEDSAFIRARTLLDEVRELLANIAVSVGGSDSPAASSYDAPEVVAALKAARQAAPGSTPEEIERLRTALETASDRPRDVDTMLDLVGRIDALVALLTAHDRYAAAIDSAIQALDQSDTGSSTATSDVESAPSFAEEDVESFATAESDVKSK